MKMEPKINIHNRFDVQVHDINGNLKQEAVGYNNVLDQMYDRLCGGYPYFIGIHFGEGTGTLSPSRTSLFSWLGYKDAVTEETIKAIPVSSWKRKIVLAAEEYVNKTITEVGIAYGSNTLTLVTHAMLKDAEGNQISITKKDTDVISIYATVFVTFDNTTIPELNYLKMPSGNSLVNYLIGGSAAPTGTFGLSAKPQAYSRLGSTAAVSWTADTINKKRIANTTRFGIDTANGDAQTLDFTNIFELKLPATNIFNASEYFDVVLGTGDGIEDTFEIPSKNLVDGTLIIKKDGSTTTALTTTKENIFTPNAISLGGANKAVDVAISADGKVAAFAFDTSEPYVLVYDVIDNRLVARPSISDVTHKVQTVSLSDDGNVLAVAGYTTSPYAQVFDWNGTAWTIRVAPPGLSYNTYAAAISGDGNVLIFCIVGYSPYAKVYDWNGTAWTIRPALPNITNYCMAVAINSNGNVIATGSNGDSPYAQIWDWNGTAWTIRVAPPSMPTRNYGVDLNADGNVLAVATYTTSPYVKVWDWNGIAWTARPALPGIGTYGVDVSLSPSGNILAVAMSNSLPHAKIWDWNGTAWTARPDIAGTVQSNKVAIADGSRLLSAYGSNAPYFQDFTNESISKTTVVFTTPPAVGEELTADYKVNGIHKTTNQVIDVGFSIQFGEGV